MSEPLSQQAWLTANGEFLAASVAWIRKLLREQAATVPAASAVKAAGAPAASGREAASGQAAAAGSAAELGRHADQLAGQAPPPALVTLAARLGLSRFERDVLLLCATAELDPSVRGLCAAAHGHEAMTYPTFALALTVLPGPAWNALTPGGALRTWRLIEVSQARGEALVSAPLRTDERIVNYLKGIDHLDVRLRALVQPAPPADAALLAESQAAAAESVAAQLAGGQPAGPVRPVIQLAGPDRRGALAVASNAATQAGRELYLMPAGVLPGSPDELDDLARLWYREATLSPVLLCVDGDGADATTGPPARDADLAAFATRLGVPVLVRAREPVPGLSGYGPLLDIDPPTMAERRTAWRRHLPPDSRADPDALAAQFTLDTTSIAAAAADPDPWARCRALTRPDTGGYAQRIEPKAGWDDLVLGERQTESLQAIADQVRNRWRVYEDWGFAAKTTRGLGLSALFTGPSGTGKTLAAEVLAADLNLDLYRTDLSAVVSKYIGETEKHLRRLFDAAEAGGWLLFFDEADALFGKRTEVTDSRDRFANIQIDYLLQRIEAYQGLAILATNMRSAMDEAFLRRLRFIVEFPFPDTAARRAIWALSFPAAVPGAAGLDLDRLAELPANGGVIRNIAMNAAFLAAARGGDLDMDLVMRAARDEFAKLQLPLRQRDLARKTVPA
jgi:hypothetical protein